MTLVGAESVSGGLTAEQVAAFHDHGFVVVRGFVGPAELEPVRRFCRDELGAWQTEVRDGARRYRVAIWTHLDESFFGRLPRAKRIVDAVEQLLRARCYHWHSKLLRKAPGDGGVSIHQDFATWYEDGCLGPQLLTCSIAVDRNDDDNGCVRVVPGSHRLARFHRVRLGETIDTHGADPVRVQAAIARLGIQPVELDPGDAMFFHCNLLHDSLPNHSDRHRTILHLSYNAVENEPLPMPGQAHHRHRPLVVLPDDAVFGRLDVPTAFDDTFHPPETDTDPGYGVFYRRSDADVRQRS